MIDCTIARRRHVQVSKPERLIAIVAMVFALSGLSLAHAQQNPEQSLTPYPSGADAISVLEEVWNYSVENIDPEDRAKFFDRPAYEKLKRELRANDELALADLLNPFLDRLAVSHTRSIIDVIRRSTC